MSGRDFDGDVAQHLLPVVGKIEIADGDGALELIGLRSRGLGRRVDVRFGFEDGLHPHNARAGPVELVDHPADGDHRPDELELVAGELDELPEGEVAPCIEKVPAPQQQQQHQRQLVDSPHQGLHPGLDPCRFEVVIDILPGELAESLCLGLFLGEALDDPDPGEVLLGERAEIREGLLCLEDRGMYPWPDLADRQCQQGEGDQQQEGQLDADRQHQRDCDHEHAGGVGRVHDDRAGQDAYPFNILCAARQDVAGFPAVVEALVKPLEMGEESVTQVKFDLARSTDDKPPDGEKRDASYAGEAHDEQQEDLQSVEGRQGVHPLGTAHGFPQQVDAISRQPGNGQQRADRQGCHQDAGKVPAPVWFREGQYETNAVQGAGLSTRVVFSAGILFCRGVRGRRFP